VVHMPLVRPHERKEVTKTMSSNSLSKVDNQIIAQEIHFDGKEKGVCDFFCKELETIEKVIKFSEESMVFIVDEEVERSSNFTVSTFQRFGHVEGSVCRYAS